MPRINDNFLDCVIYLYHSRVDAEHGTIHANGGSGFLVGIPSAIPNFVHIYAVSNRHVIEVSPIVRMNTRQGDMDILDLKPKDWTFTPDQDVAVCPVKLSANHKFKCVPLATFLTKEIVESERIGPGDDVFMVGRFVNHEGRQRNTPSVRFGNLAMMPDEPVFHQSNTSGEQISFLADIRTIGGYSGSPVFLSVRVIDFDGTGKWTLFAKDVSSPWLLGVDWGHITDHVKINTGMAGIVPAWILSDLLNSPKLTELRQTEDARAAQEPCVWTRTN